MYAYKVIPVMFNSLKLCGLQPARLPHPWGSPGKNTEVGCYALLQGIFPTQGSNPHLLGLLCLLHWQAGSLPVVLPGKPIYLYTGIQIQRNRYREIFYNCFCGKLRSKSHVFTTFPCPLPHSLQLYQAHCGLSLSLSYQPKKNFSLSARFLGNFLICLYTIGLEGQTQNHR